MQPHKTLVIIRGLPGSGKSALAQIIAPENNYAADNYGVYDLHGNYLIEKQQFSHEACFSDTLLALCCGVPIVAVHNTFVEMRFYIDYLIIGALEGYFCQVIDCEGGLHFDGGESKTVHKVPPAVIESMRSRWQSYRPLIRAESLENEITVFAEKVGSDPNSMTYWVSEVARDEMGVSIEKLLKTGSSFWKQANASSGWRFDPDFWRLVNSYKYWEKVNRMLGLKATFANCNVGNLGVSEFAELYYSFWYSVPDLYRKTTKEVMDRFVLYVEKT